jgi:hypothetical protein
MKRTTKPYPSDQRFSVRASISLWMLIAGLVWVTLGLAITYVTRSDENAMEAAGHRLSTIAPAAGPNATPPKP